MPGFVEYFPWLFGGELTGRMSAREAVGRPGVAKRRKSRKAQRVARRVGRHA